MIANLSLEEQYMLLLDFFGEKVQNPFIDTDKMEIDCILYGSFIFKFGIEIPKGNFKGGIFLDSQHVVNNFQGEELSLTNTKESVLNNFKIIDLYCRLRLPDKFLSVYE